MVKLPPKDAYEADILNISPLSDGIALTRANTQIVNFSSFLLICPFINFFDTRSFVFHFPTFSLENKTVHSVNNLFLLSNVYFSILCSFSQIHKEFYGKFLLASAINNIKIFTFNCLLLLKIVSMIFQFWSLLFCSVDSRR